MMSTTDDNNDMAPFDCSIRSESKIYIAPYKHTYLRQMIDTYSKCHNMIPICSNYFTAFCNTFVMHKMCHILYHFHSPLASFFSITIEWPLHNIIVNIYYYSYAQHKGRQQQNQGHFINCTVYSSCSDIVAFSIACVHGVP